MHKVVIAGHLEADAAEWLARIATLARVQQGDAPALHRELSDADGLILRSYTPVDSNLLKLAPHLKVIGRAGVGLDHIDLRACSDRSVRVVYTPDANTQAVVEYVWTLILDATRTRSAIHAPITPSDFHMLRERFTAKHQLSQRVLGILGIGRIGRRVAQVARAFGMSILYNDLLNEEQLHLPPDIDARPVSKDELWAGSDILTLHIDGRESNRHLIGRQVLSQLKPHCILLNTSRGSVIDGPALADWARRVQPTGGMAILDVHDPEPPPANYPLWGIPNVHLFPHLASRTEASLHNMSWVVRDVASVLDGRPPLHPAN